MKILVIAAHPDDETIGCGGTLAKLAKNHSNRIYVTFATDGVYGREGEKIAAIRKKESLLAAKIIGAKILNESLKKYYPFSDQQIDKSDFNEIVSFVKTVIEETKPEIIYTHFAGDLNRDHQIIAEAFGVATRPNKYEFIKKIYAFEINMGSLNQGHILRQPFLPNVFEKVDIKAKIKMLSTYKSEQKYWGSWRQNAETIARFRGLDSGYEFAEGFILLRERLD